MQAIKQISDEKGLSFESVLETIQAALAAAYRKDFGKKNQNVKVEFDPETGNLRAFDVKTVTSDELAAVYAAEEEARMKAAEEGEEKKREEAPHKEEAKQEEAPAEGEEKELRFNPKLHISLAEAKKIKPDAALDEIITTELEVPGAFGRMAAQTAKQVITQRLREAERQNVFDEYKSKEHELINGVVQRREGRVVLIDLGRVTGVMLPEDQIPGEAYVPGARVKVYVTSVQLTSRGPELLVSRTSADIVRKLFTLEIPEIAAGTVVIKDLAREAGARTKVAVYSEAPNVDPIGSCIGQRGTRIQTIITELGGEKIDIIQYDESAEKFIMNSLSPAKISSISLDETLKTATVTVSSDQLSLAIGRGGQNVRLAARLTGWKINVVEAGADAPVAVAEAGEETAKSEEPIKEGADAPAESEPETKE